MGIYGPNDTPGPIAARTWGYAAKADGTITLGSGGLGAGTWTAHFLAKDGYEPLADPITFTLTKTTSTDVAVVQGTVFKDLDADGVRDSGEPGMGGVSVTDGEVWSKSEADGSYSFQMDRTRRETDLVQIVSPNGYTPALRDDSVPQHFRNVPAGPSPLTGLDFALVPDKNAANPKEKWSMVSDVEVSNTTDASAASGLPTWTGRVKAMSENLETTMTITTGDLTVTDYAAEPRRQGGYDVLRNGLTAGKLGHAFYPVVGNHDVGGTATSVGYGGIHGVLAQEHGPGVVQLRPQRPPRGGLGEQLRLLRPEATAGMAQGGPEAPRGGQAGYGVRAPLAVHQVGPGRRYAADHRRARQVRRAHVRRRPQPAGRIPPRRVQALGRGQQHGHLRPGFHPPRLQDRRLLRHHR